MPQPVVCLLDGAARPRGLPDLPEAAPGELGGRADVLLVWPGVSEVAADAVDRLQTAADESTVATVSALPAEVTDLSTTPSWKVRSPPVHPRLEAPLPGLVLVRRAAIDLAGAPVPLEEFARRCSALGLAHLLAEDVLVPGSPPEAEEGTALRRALDAVAIAGRRVTVTVDGRALGPYRAGTQVHLLELIAALARTGRADVRVVVAHDLAPDAAELFAREERISTITYEEAAHGDPEPTDVVHRPSQVFTPDDLALLVPLGRRVVVTHQDLIAYHSPAYHDGPEHWERLRSTTRLALGAADHVVFFSEHAMRDALSEDLVDPARASVVPIGADHHVATAADPVRPDGVETPYLLMLGADLPHKNRPFARALADALNARGWDGRLLTAGPGDTDLGPVGEAEKAWLLANAAAVAYPTTYEGFGLIPFEAGAAGVPCAFAPVSSLAEVLPRELAVIEPWDAEASAAALEPLLHSGPQREAHVAGLREASDRFTWEATANGMVDLYERVVGAPLADARRDRIERLRLHAEQVQTDRLRREEWERFQAFREEIGSDALGLVGPGGILDAADQRALLALGSRRAVKRPLFALLRGAYRVVKR